MNNSNLEWWQIKSNLFLQLCLVTQRLINKLLNFIVNCGILCFLTCTYIAHK